MEILIASLSKATLDQYQVALNQWVLFCKFNETEFLNPRTDLVLKFLTRKFKEGASYGTLNSYRSALSLISSDKIGDDPMISRFFKGIFKLKPSFPKYSFTWDVSTVLIYVAGMFPLDSLSFTSLTLKTVILLALCTAQRAQTLASIAVENILIKKDELEIRIQELIKTSRPGKAQPLLLVPFFQAQPELCVASTLLKYIEVSSSLRGNISKLFISIKKPYKAVTSQTISRWIKQVLTKSGIDTSVFSGHSTRHAATSAAHKKGINLDVIRKTAGWTQGSKMFAKVYNRPIRSNNQSFAQAIFDSIVS